MTSKCPKCGKDFHIYMFFKNSRKYNAKPFATCFNCRPNQKSNDNVDTAAAAAVKLEESSSVFASTGAIIDNPIKLDQQLRSHHKDMIESNIARLQNVTFDKILGWQRAARPRHPRIRVRATTEEDHYASLGLPHVRIAPFHIDVVTDSGAQSCVWG